MARFQRITTALPLLLLSFLFRLILLCCSIITLGIFAYFLATLTDHSLPIHTWVRAVTGIAGVSTLYLLFACTFVFCCGGKRLLSGIAVLLDLAFIGAWIYVAYQTRGATNGCGYGNYVKTPIGKGIAGKQNTVTGGDGGVTILPKLRTACRLQQAVFGVAIVAILFYLFALLLELALMRSHAKQKKFGPSPANNYTRGRGAGMFSRLPFMKRKDPNPLYPETDKRHPDSLVATHPEPEKGAYLPPTGTAVLDDSKETRYGHGSTTGHPGAHMPGTTSTTNGTGYAQDVNPYSGTSPEVGNTGHYISPAASPATRTTGANF